MSRVDPNDNAPNDNADPNDNAKGGRISVMASKSVVKPRPKLTDLQGQYLAFIQAYTTLHGLAPAEADMQRFFRVTPPTVHRMVLALDERGLIERVPGRSRSIRLLLPSEEIPRLERREKAQP